MQIYNYFRIEVDFTFEDLNLVYVEIFNHHSVSRKRVQVYT